MKTAKITATALLLSVSFILSLLEGYVPLNLVPGLKLGFANIAVTTAVYMLGMRWAFLIVVLRPILSLLLFGNFTSFVLSLSGGIIAFASVCATKKLYGKICSFCGISVISAVCHSIGQIVAAIFVVSDSAVLSYLPLLCAASSVTGFITGCVMNSVIPRIIKYGASRYEFKA